MPSSSDGRVTVVELWLRTDSAAEANSVESALKRLQLRIYPDIIGLSQAFMAYSRMYEQCKADQIDACAQYSKAYMAVQVWLTQPLPMDGPVTSCPLQTHSCCSKPQAWFRWLSSHTQQYAR